MNCPTPTARTKVSVIVPTVCTAGRRSTLLRAIDSVMAQEGVRAELIVVVNGGEFDRSTYETLRQDQRLITIYCDEAHVSHARRAGLAASSAQYFCFLDDDDEYLPGGLAARIAAMDDNPQADIVVTDGFIRGDGEFLSLGSDLVEAVRRDPGDAFLRRNWFDSPASMFRRSSVELAFFDIPYKYFEWTYLFFRLFSAGKCFYCSDAITYRKYENHPDSVSKGRDYLLALPSFLRDLRILPLPPAMRRGIHTKYVTALNQSSGIYLESGDLRQAFACHLRCLLAGGWRYLPYSRRLLFLLLMRLLGRV